MRRKASDVEIHLELLNIELNLVDCLAGINPQLSENYNLRICQTAGKLIDEVRDLRGKYSIDPIQYGIIEAVYATVRDLSTKTLALNT